MLRQVTRTIRAAQIPSEVLDVIDVLVGAGHRAFVVGGAVRDVFRGAEPHDWDVATSARPETVQGLFPDVLPSGLAHGTVTVVRAGNPIEVTTFRSEGAYTDGRRPSSVEFHESIELDLSRRDFTFNAMAWSPHEGLVDPFDGLVDLERGHVRSVREAKVRFAEDGLRPLRAVRFATTLGFELEGSTEEAISHTLDVFRRVAVERWRVEFDKVVLHHRASAGLSLLRRTGLLGAMVPEALVAELPDVAGLSPELAQRIAALIARAEQPRQATVRLRLTATEADEVHALLSAPPLPPADATDGALRRWLAAVGVRRLESVLALREVLGLRAGALAPRLRALAAENPPLTVQDLALDGKEILAVLGVKPGRIMRDATNFLLDVVFDAPERNSPEALAEALRAWHAKRGNG